MTASQVSKAVLHGNAGLLRFSQQDYAGAVEEFEAAAAADPADSAAVNNAAICQLLNTQVGAATSSGLFCVCVDTCQYITWTEPGAVAAYSRVCVDRV